MNELLQRFDQHLLQMRSPASAGGLQRAALDLLYFGLKEARACLFAGLFFVAMFAVPRDGLLGLPRYDALLVIAVAIQGWMLWAKLETMDELKAITLFHLLGFALEVFKTSDGIWLHWHWASMPGPAYSSDRWTAYCACRCCWRSC